MLLFCAVCIALHYLGNTKYFKNLWSNISAVCQPHRATFSSSSQLPPLSLLSCQSLLNSLASVLLEWALFLQVITHKMTSKQYRQAPKKRTLQSQCCPLVGWSESQLLAGWLTVLVNNALFFFLLFSSQVSYKFISIWLISDYQNLAGLFYFSIQLVSSIDGDFSATFECSQPQSLLKVWLYACNISLTYIFLDLQHNRREKEGAWHSETWLLAEMWSLMSTPWWR